MTESKPLAEDIPLERAWKVGRRIYVRCGYKSQLNDEIRALGGKWDREERALWVGSGKADQVITAVRAAEERGAKVEEIKAAGYEIAIPYARADVREFAKGLGAIWQAASKTWALPTADALGKVQAALAAQPVTNAQPAASRPKRTPAPEIDAVIADSGRTVIGDQVKAEKHLGKMRRTDAEQHYYAGQIVAFEGGRALVVQAKFIWVSEDTAEDTGNFGSEGFWADLILVPIEPTDAEVEAKRKVEERAELRKRIVDIFAHALGRTRPVDRFDAGEVVVARWLETARGIQIGRRADGVWLVQHPGHYDDYRLSQCAVEDPAEVDVLESLTANDRFKADRYTYIVTPRKEA